MSLSTRPAAAVVGTAVMMVLAWGCATTGERSRPAPDATSYSDSLSIGINALQSGSYAEARGPLRWLAARCEAGVHGRRATLLLAMAALDPRNPDASADEGARLAAGFLALPGNDPGERLVAETLYLLALDRGGAVDSGDHGGGADSVRTEGHQEPGGVATPGDSAGAGPSTVAARYYACDDPLPASASDDAALPDLPGAPTTELFRRARAARDSLAHRVAELEAELERIRELLQGGVDPDTSGA